MTMSRPRRAGLALALTLGLVAAACGGGGGSTSDVEVASDGTFTATALDGESVDLAALAGDDVLLWFWAPW